MSDPKVEVALPAANGLKGETEVDNNGAVIADEDTKSSMDEDSNSAKSQKINSPSLIVEETPSAVVTTESEAPREASAGKIEAEVTVKNCNNGTPKTNGNNSHSNGSGATDKPSVTPIAKEISANGAATVVAKEDNEKIGAKVSEQNGVLSFPNMAPLNPTSLSGELPPMSEPFSIIAIGNPGSGKSTTLNYLAQKFVFKSGPSIGSGLTYKLDEEEVRVTCSNGKTVQITFYDTPGLNDAGKRVAAGEAISKALKKGGKTKILFFIGQESGRPKQDDVTTMNLVLEAAPEIGQNYGVILPKISLKMARKWKNGWNTFLLGLFAGLQNGERQCHPVCVQGVLLNKDLEDEENVLVPGGEMKTLDDFPLEEFVFSTLLPSIRLTKDLAEKKRKELQKQQNLQKCTKMEQLYAEAVGSLDLPKSSTFEGTYQDFEKSNGGVKFLLDISNFSKWDLVFESLHAYTGWNPRCSDGLEVIPPVPSGQRTALWSQKSRMGTAGNCGVITWKIEGTSKKLSVMYVVPWQHYRGGKNHLAVGIFPECTETNRAHYDKMESQKEEGHWCRRPYYRDLLPIDQTFENFTVFAQMGSSHTPKIFLKFFPAFVCDFAPSLTIEDEKTGVIILNPAAQCDASEIISMDSWKLILDSYKKLTDKNIKFLAGIANFTKWPLKFCGSHTYTGYAHMDECLVIPAGKMQPFSGCQLSSTPFASTNQTGNCCVLVWEIQASTKKRLAVFIDNPAWGQSNKLAIGVFDENCSPNRKLLDKMGKPEIPVQNYVSREFNDTIKVIQQTFGEFEVYGSMTKDFDCKIQIGIRPTQPENYAQVFQLSRTDFSFQVKIDEFWQARGDEDVFKRE